MLKKIILFGMAFASSPTIEGRSSPPPPPTPHAISNISCKATSNHEWKIIDGIYFTLHECTYTATGSKGIKIEERTGSIKGHSNCSLNSCYVWLADNKQHSVRFLSSKK